MIKQFLQKYGTLYAVFIFFIVLALASPILKIFTLADAFCFGGFILMLWSLLIKRREFIDNYFVKLEWKLILPIVGVWLYYFVSFWISPFKFRNPVYIDMVIITLGCLFIGVIVLFANTKGKFYFLLKIAELFFLVNILIGVCQLFLPFNLVVAEGQSRFIFEGVIRPYVPKGMFYNENEYIAFIVGYFPLFLYTHRKKMLWDIIVASVLAFLCMASGARGGYAALAFFGIIFGGAASIALLFKKMNIRAWTKDILLLVLIILIPYGIHSLPERTKDYLPQYSTTIRIDSIFGDILAFFGVDTVTAPSDGIRIVLLKHALSKWSQDAKTITFGLGTRHSVFIDADISLKLFKRELDVFYLHNGVLEVLVEGGAILFLYILFLLIISLIKYLRVLQRVKRVDMQYAAVCKGILYAILTYGVAAVISCSSFLSPYMTTYLLLGLYLCVLNLHSKEKLDNLEKNASALG